MVVNSLHVETNFVLQERPRAVFEATVKRKETNAVTGVSCWVSLLLDWICKLSFVEVGSVCTICNSHLQALQSCCNCPVLCQLYSALHILYCVSVCFL